MRYKVLVKEVMKTDVKKLDINDPVEKAAKMMKTFNISSVVVFSGNDVKGIITSEDIVYKYVAERKGQRVSDIMSEKLLSIPSNKTIEDAARIMSEKMVKKLLVMENDKLVGIITTTDILKIEPALYEILLERMKIRGSAFREPSKAPVQCEICGNYSDDVVEIDGVWVCSECEELK